MLNLFVTTNFSILDRLADTSKRLMARKSGTLIKDEYFYFTNDVASYVIDYVKLKYVLESFVQPMPSI